MKRFHHVVAQYASASIKCARFHNMSSEPTPEQVQEYTLHSALECDLAMTHLYLLLMDVCIIQLLQYAQSG